MNPNPQPDQNVIVGFTGTRDGMTPQQKQSFDGLIRALRITEFHHGDCLGADADAHALVRLLSPPTRIAIHPPDNFRMAAYCKGDVAYGARPYLERNADIVNVTDVMIACPKEFVEIQRSGTWATIRLARKRDKRLYIIGPKGIIGS